MVENLETLLALSRAGTMIEASTELRISQSAVSKRIAALENYYDRKLIQKKSLPDLHWRQCHHVIAFFKDY